MNKTAIAIATAATLSLLAGPLLAQSSSPTSRGANTGMGGSMADTESVGQSAPTGGNKEVFEQLDENGDGQLDETELSAYGTTAAGTGVQGTDDLMQQLDEDQDGALSEKEFTDNAVAEPGGSTGPGNSGAGATGSGATSDGAAGAGRGGSGAGGTAQ